MYILTDSKRVQKWKSNLNLTISPITNHDIGDDKFEAKLNFFVVVNLVKTFPPPPPQISHFFLHKMPCVIIALDSPLSETMHVVNLYIYT